MASHGHLGQLGHSLGHLASLSLHISDLCVFFLFFAVVQAKPDLCSYGYLPVSSTSGYIASVATQEHDIGSSRCPWVIKVLPGQRINVTLLDFGLTADLQGEAVTGSSVAAPPPGKPTHPRYCREYATLRETKSVRTVVVCDGDPVQKHMYLSDDHVVEIEVAKSESSAVQFRFLLKYEGQYRILNLFVFTVLYSTQ